MESMLTMDWGPVVACGKYPDSTLVKVVKLDKSVANDIAYGYYKELDENTLYMRFMAVVKDPRRVVDTIASKGCVFIAALVNGKLVGMGELCPASKNGCEGALSVRPEYRRRGVGSILLLSMLCLCEKQGGTRLLGEVLIINDVALRFFKRVGGVVESIDEGVIRGYIPVSRGRALVSLVLADRGVRAYCNECT